MKELSEHNLGDMILCEPLTNRGIEALGNLGLKDDVSEDVFFKEMYINPKYAEKKLSSKPVDDPVLEHIYSVSSERFDEIKRKLEDFNQKFTSDSVNQSPLLIIGTAGNGKSIETQYKIRNPKRGDKIIKCNRVFYNLEKSLTELTYGYKYSLNDEQARNALWLICIALLEGLYKLVGNHWKSVSTIVKNHQKYFIKHNSADDAEKKLFSCIKKYRPHNFKTEERLFRAMTDLINEKNARQSIENLLKKTMNVMYCICPENKNYIVFDNLEHYIKLNERSIPIHNRALSDIYESVMKVTGDSTNIYDRIHHEESWRAFKIILVLRRTSEHLLVQSNAHNASRLLGMENDYTGHFDIWRIWEKKTPNIWEKYLKDKYDPDQSSTVVSILDDMMGDNPDDDTLGISYQNQISPLMNYGIRRNGSAQAHAAICVYGILFKYKDCYIDFEIYKKLLGNALKSNKKLTSDAQEKNKELPSGVKLALYLYRRALLEIQYKRMITPDESQKRFTKLCLGELSEPKESRSTDKLGRKIIMREVEHNKTKGCHVTLVRRILSYLSNFIDETVINIENSNVFKTGLFETKSFYDLMAGIFLNPVETWESKHLTRDDHYLPLSTVLVSLGSMAHSATKAAPFVILDINDEDYARSGTESVLADIFEKIWNAGPKESTGNGKYKCNDYSVRLTEAGDVFLRDIQPSFSFFAALYCSEEVPLFFLTDPKRIKFVITSVYSAAENLCKDYELAANNFCGPDVTLRESDHLPKYKGECVTFRNRVMDMHSHHLNLYKDFIEKNASVIGLNENKADFKDMMKQIEKTISSYNSWKTNEKEKIPECF